MSDHAGDGWPPIENDPSPRDEIGLRRQEIANSHEYAQQVLRTRSEDERSRRRDQLTFSGFVIAMITGLIIYALYIGKEVIAQEALKDIALFSVGGVGGYAIGREKGETAADTDD